MLWVYPSDEGRDVGACLLLAVKALRGIVMAVLRVLNRLSQQGLSWLTRGREHEAVIPRSCRAPSIRAAAGPPGRLRLGAFHHRPVIGVRNQRLRAKAAVVHADGADEQGGVLCALLALQPRPTLHRS